MRGMRIPRGLRVHPSMIRTLAPSGSKMHVDPARLAALGPAASEAISGAMVADELEKETLYGIDSGLAGVAAAATAIITVRPQRRHVPERFVVSAVVAGAFILTDISVGVTRVLATTGTVSCASFLPESTARPFKSIVCEPGTDVTVSATNVSGANARFIGNMHGRPV